MSRVLRCGRMSAARPFAIGVDLGGTRLKVARVDADGELRDFDARPSRIEESAEAPLAAIEGAVRERLVGGSVIGIGVGCPGVIDDQGRLVDRTAHLPHWIDLDLREALERRLSLPVAIENDANLAALAEHVHGAARGARVSIAVTLGTGIGCGIVIEGRIFRGARGGAGELGHVPLGSGADACACGVPQCVEPEASGSGLARAAARLGFEPADAETVFQRAAGGDAAARELVERFADRLGATLAAAVNILDPEVVVIGGGLLGAGEQLIEPVRAAVQRYTLGSHRRGLRVVPARLGEGAGVVGAGLLAWERFGARSAARP
jgi:glucokinase